MPYNFAVSSRSLKTKFVLQYYCLFCVTGISLANVNSRLRSLYAIVRPSVCRVVCLSSVTFVRPTQAIDIFRNVSTPFGTLAICDLSIKILRRSSHTGEPHFPIFYSNTATCLATSRWRYLFIIVRLRLIP